MAKDKGLIKILTKDKLSKLYFREGLSFAEIADKYGCQSSNIAYYFNKYNLKGRCLNGSFNGGIPWNKGRRVKDETIDNERYLKGIRTSRKYGKEHPNYKNGYWINKSGYKVIQYQNQIKRVSVRIFEHRLVMEKCLRRRLEDWECVHHINGDKLDNRVENLLVVDRSEHTKLHHDGGLYPQTRMNL